MFELIKKIMEKAKAENVDIAVAQRMLINEGADTLEMNKAFNIYNKSYEDISILYDKGDFDSIKKVVELGELKKYDEIKELMKDLTE